MASNSWLFLNVHGKEINGVVATYQHGTNKWLGSWKEATVMCLIKIDIEAEQSIEELYIQIW